MPLILITALALSGCAASVATQANGFAEKKEWDEAVFKYKELVEKEPSSLEYRNKYSRARFEAAQIHFQRGKEHLESGGLEAAAFEFQAALLLEPGFDKAQGSLKKVKRLMDSLYYYGKGIELLKDGKEKEARSSFTKAVGLNPGNQVAALELEKLKQGQKLRLDGQELNMKSMEPVTLEFRDAGLYGVFEVLARLSGINFIFDEDLKDAKTTILLRDLPFPQALDLILATNKLGRKVANDSTIIIYPATPQKAQQYEEMMIRVFYLTNTDAKKTVNLLKTMLRARDVQIHEELNAIVIRARPDIIELAQKILEATDLADSEVMLAVEIVEVNRNKAQSLGIDLSPDTITAKVPTTNNSTTLGDLKGLSSGQLLLGLPSMILDLKKEDVDANVLANPRIRVKNNGKAKIHIGDRVPIITTTVNQGVSTENIQYQDVGLKLGVEPTVRPDDEVDLKVALEVSTIGAKTVTTSGSIAYQIGTRNAETVLRLHDGETQIIGGLINDEERSTVARIPLLGDIPVIGSLFSRTELSKVKTDILLSITPYIIKRLEIPEQSVTSFLSGKDENPSARPMLESFSPEGVGPEPPVNGDPMAPQPYMNRPHRPW